MILGLVLLILAVMLFSIWRISCWYYQEDETEEVESLDSDSAIEIKIGNTSVAAPPNLSVTEIREILKTFDASTEAN